MVCIYCGSKTEVTNSRSKARITSVWRRRQCKACVAQFSTSELPDFDTSLAVKTNDGKLKPLNRDKLFLSLYQALGHRPDALKSATELTFTILGLLLRTHKPVDGTIEASMLAKTALNVLKRYDALSAHTYKAYHKAVLKDSKA